MRRQGRRVALLCGLIAGALACTSGTGRSGTTAAEGTHGNDYNVIVPRPEHGTVISSDVLIRCGTSGALCGDAITGTRYAWSTPQVTLSFIADDGYHFEGWAGDCRGKDPTCTVTRGADRTVVAAFLPDAAYPGTYFTVTIARPVGGTISSSGPYGIRCTSDGPPAACGPIPIKWDDSVTLTALATEGYVFGGWSGACSGKAPCTLTREGA